MITAICLIGIATVIVHSYAKLKWSAVRAEAVYFIGSFVCTIIAFIGFVNYGGSGWGIAALALFIFTGMSLLCLFDEIDESLKGDTL